MADPLDQILELLNRDATAAAQRALDDVDSSALTDAALGRLLALRVAWLLQTGQQAAAHDELAAAFAATGPRPAVARGLDATLAQCHRAPRAAVELPVQRWLGRCQEALGDPLAAARTYRELVARQPQAVDLWREVARCERAADDPASAAHTMRRYVELAPDDAAGWASLGDFLDDAGDDAGADAAWQRALELDPDDAILHYNWGVAAGRRGELERVRSCLLALRARDRHDPLALALESILLEADGEIARGWQAMRAAVEQETGADRAQALAHRALRYAERNALAAEARELVDALHRRDLLDEDVLQVANRLEHRRTEHGQDYSVVVDAVPAADWCPQDLAPDGAPRVRYLRWLRVVAESADEATTLALACERRCGATDVRIEEVHAEAALQEPDHAGVWQRQERPDYYDPGR